MGDYITELRFENFQSLKSTSIPLEPGFNVIVGPSNLGKSAALRGIRALMRNAPAPGLIREGAKEFKLTASFSNGTVVELAKGKNKSVFTLDDKDYPKSGVKAPEEVIEKWAMPAPDGRELGFASQHEPPFLLSEPASAVAKVLGDLTNASVLMEAVSKANKMRTEALNDSKARRREAEEALEAIKSHAGLTSRTKALEAAREAYRAATEAATEIAELDLLISRHDLLVEDLERAELFLSQNTDLTAQLERAEELVKGVKTFELYLNTYNTLQDQLTQAVNEILDTKKLANEAENEIHQLLEDAGVCPLCGSETK